MKKNVVVGLVLLAATLMVFTGSDAAAQSGEDNPAEVQAGMTVYSGSCAGCHGAEGEGSSRGRPLTGIASQGDRGTHFASVSEGKGGMPAFSSQLSVEQIDASLSYVRLTFVEEAATTDTAESELAVTGAETPLLALGGVAMVAAGAMAVYTSRRFDR